MATRCPKALLAENGLLSEAAFDEEGRGPLGSWGMRSSVRTRPWPDLIQLGSGSLFPPELVPVASHHLLDEAGGLRDKIIGRHLYRYMHFTAKLEHLVVNRVALALAHDETGFRMPERIRMEAFKLYCDEAYHAVIAAEIAFSVARDMELTADWQELPYFMKRLEKIKSEAGAELAPLLNLLFVICSETLISGTLGRAAESPDLDGVVRQALQDHAHDERRHHAYFREVLRHLWSQLSQRSRAEAGVWVPALIDTFLCPDFHGLEEELRSYGLSPDVAQHVVSDSYPSSVVREDRNRFARYTLRYFAELDAISDQAVAEAFATAGFDIESDDA
jgi:hypothetical protein